MERTRLRPPRLVGGTGTTSSRTLLAVLGLFLIGWLTLTQLLIPLLIHAVYRGIEVPILTAILDGRHVHPAVHYLRLIWERLSLPVLFIGLSAWLPVYVMSRSAFFRRCVGEATPGALGAIRMWVCAILLVNVVQEDLSTIGWLPQTLRRSMGIMTLLHALPLGLDQLVTSELGLRAFQAATAVALFLGMIGWATRLVVPLGAVLSLVLFGIVREYSFFWHQNLVAFYVLMTLAFTPCGDGWSVDRLRKIARGQPVPPAERPAAVYGWSRYACWVALAMPYLAAGLSKLRNVGWLWWAPDNMRRFLYGDTLNPVHFDWTLSLQLADAPDLLFAALGIAGVWGEALYALVLVSRIARRVMPLAMAGMHVGIVFFQNILFLDLILLQAIFFDFTRLRTALARWLASRRGLVRVLYDGWCPLCRRTVRVLGALDLFRRLELLDFRTLDLAAFNRRQGLRLTPEALEQEMAVVARGRASAGFAGYRILALVLPACWWLAPWLYLPGMASLGRAVYRLVARNRLRLLRCDEHCATGPAHETAQVATATVRGGPVRLRHAAPVGALLAALFLSWFYRVEFYPLTAMQMYTERRRLTDDIIYYTPLARLASGRASKKLFREAVGTLAINARFRPRLKWCFGRPEEVAACKTFLTATGAGYNRRAAPERRVVQFEIEKWATTRSNPRERRLVDRFTLELDEPGAGPRLSRR